jgi:excisionase family DNA binding protein
LINSNVVRITDFSCHSLRRKFVKKFLTTEEVAVLLRQKPRTITEWAKAYEESGGGEGLPAHRMGRRWLFVEAEIMERFETNSSASEADIAANG